MNKTLSLYDITSDVSQKLQTSDALTEEIVNLALSRICQAMIDGDTVKIRGFGTFKSDTGRKNVKFVFSRRIVDFVRRFDLFEKKYGVNPLDFRFFE